ncbi:hypothetical protein [Chitinophaga nivalis]|uniref:Uncharacterized protein n=1 Tax=Chitinophaga nivalis TaxID=2991709 RepID=A0ABT3ILR5_9BACT|nr:hypothetical protein [Chitinophaga nivalis]MCW3465457.1 hypothetical protein [Chitinophaga nivalis]MCW3484851.1 hypothetical protein [Chitinophaga nivalis]
MKQYRYPVTFTFGATATIPNHLRVKIDFKENNQAMVTSGLISYPAHTAAMAFEVTHHTGTSFVLGGVDTLTLSPDLSDWCDQYQLPATPFARVCVSLASSNNKACKE